MPTDSAAAEQPTKPEQARPSLPVRSRRLTWWLAGLAVVALLAPIFRTEYFSCATCGDRLRTTSVFGVRVTSEETVTECGTWFREHVERDHTHLGYHGTYEEATSFVGFPRLPSNIAGRMSGPTSILPSGLKLEIYRHSSDPKRVRDLLVSLARWDRSTPEAASRQLKVVRHLEERGTIDLPEESSPASASQ